MSVAGLSLAELRTAYVGQSVPIARVVADRHVQSVAVGVGAVGVLGVSGGVGTTIVALAVAEALSASRLLELAPPYASGLAGAATNELGDRDGWRVGVRGNLELARRLDAAAEPPHVDGHAVLDLGAWTGETPQQVVDRVVVVAACSVPAIRRLDACLQAMNSVPLVIPVITRAGRRLPRELLGAAGPALRAAVAAGAMHVMPECPRLSLTGLTPDPLPRSLQQSAACLALRLKETS
ncbi:hypothetical protein [Tessaracoccus sp. MC1756]|uniref:hypothetical protein n=1 Tax=Tessaracoccus sp. MC1756 TaxID=2760311 RepID=UPI0016029FE7|nr:hypothetical protein [Tessaracoccus sp. MC1756]MBB1510648.1 hypothetical protein [Tessaracoccus sp. MC1756]